MTTENATPAEAVAEQTRTNWAYVRLRSGGPWMVLSGRTRSCYWFDNDGRLHEKSFPADVLVGFERPEPKQPNRPPGVSPDVWATVAAEIEQMDIELPFRSRVHLKIFSDAYADYVQARRVIEKDGPIGTNGLVRPEVALAADAASRCAELLPL